MADDSSHRDEDNHTAPEQASDKPDGAEKQEVEERPASPIEPGDFASDARTVQATSGMERSAVWRGEDRLVANPENLQVLGTLNIVFPHRTVTFVVDGDAAMRAMAAFRNRQADGVEDMLRASTSADAAWLVFDYGQALAMEWRPGMPPVASERMAVDPARPTG